jgi:hypothetical protein
MRVERINQLNNLNSNTQRVYQYPFSKRKSQAQSDFSIVLSDAVRINCNN